MMVKVLLYAYCIGVPSSRKIARRLEEDIAFRVLAANNTPDFHTISDFRKDHLKALAGLFLQVLELCQRAGLVKLGHVALDGTKIKANASKHKAMSYKRMKGEAVVTPPDKAQRNFTDPDSHIMPAPGGKHFIQAYNAQAAVDSAHQIIVAAEVTNKPSDRGLAEPMMEVVKVNTGQLPRQMSADAGYFSGDAVEKSTARGIDVYMPPDKIGRRLTLPPAPRGRIPKSLSVVDRMRRKLRTKKGRERYRLRKELPEPVFGQIKQARGFSQFLLRGSDKVSGEWRFICAGHNLLKLFRACSLGLLGQDVLAAASAQ